ncbi:hypothetical protein DINM_002326 [Dirofilaria immitis]|nr:hypothetical protein [Dirofilaria immitis]
MSQTIGKSQYEEQSNRDYEAHVVLLKYNFTSKSYLQKCGKLSSKFTLLFEMGQSTGAYSRKTIVYLCLIALTIIICAATISVLTAELYFQHQYYGAKNKSIKLIINKEFLNRVQLTKSALRPIGVIPLAKSPSKQIQLQMYNSNKTGY